MNTPYPTFAHFLEECRARIARDDDCVILYTGPTGAGKSTVAWQVLRALDPAFNADRVHFDLKDFLTHAPSLPAGAAVLMDETDATGRAAMTRQNQVLMTYLRRCRGLNHFLGICFPFHDQLDPGIANERIPYRLHVPSHGEVHIMHRVAREYHRRKSAPKVVRYWNTVARFRGLKPNSGPEWDGYRIKKRDSMRRLKELVADLEPDAASAKAASNGGPRRLIDEEGLRHFARTELRKYLDPARAAADVRANAP